MRTKKVVRRSVQRSLDRRSLVHRIERWAAHRGVAPVGLWYFSRIEGTFAVQTPGGATIRYEATKDDLIAPWLYWRGHIMDEKLELEIVSRLCRGARHFVDVGAYTGYYSLVAAVENPGITVTAFEPVPANYERLIANLRTNDVAERVEALRVAVAASDHVTTLAMNADERMPVGGHMPSSAAANETSVVHLNVPTVTLDAALGDIELDVMKIDVEGGEGDVIVGGLETLQRHRPAIVMESWAYSDARKPEGMLRDLGYRFWRLTDSAPTPVDHLSEPGPWDNYLCIARPEHHMALAL
jgi:FkbM family methyltransferase